MQKAKNAENQKCRKQKDRQSKMPKAKNAENQKCRKLKMSNFFVLDVEHENRV